MPVQETESLLMKELGQEFVKAHEQSKNVKAKQGQTLPSGLKGIAQLNEIAIKKIKEGKNVGKLMFYADAIILEPLTYNGFPVKGKRTQISEPLYATPTRKRKTIKDHLDFVYEHLKMLGVKVQDLKPSAVELAIAALKANKANVFIGFRTWQPPAATEGQYAGQEAMLMQFWDERITDFKKKDATETAVKNNLPSEPEPIPTVDEPTDEPVDPFNPPDDEPEQIDPELVDQGDIDSLAKRADETQDLEASNRLNQLATEAGIPDDVAKATKTWKELADLIKGKKPSTNGTPEEKSNEISIGIGDQFNYKPLDPTTKKPSKTAVVVQVLKIDEDKGTVDLARVDNPKMKYLNVPATDLEDIK